MVVHGWILYLHTIPVTEKPIMQDSPMQHELQDMAQNQFVELGYS